MHAKQSIDFAVALALFMAIVLFAAFLTARHTTLGIGRVDPVKTGTF